jgi:hypothetical protein
VSDVTAVAAIFTGAIGVGGTIVGGPVLRLLRWADWKTSFKDAFNVSCAAGLLATAYWHLATRVEAFGLPKIIHTGRYDRAVWLSMSVAVLSVMGGYVTLRRHGVARSIISALLVIVAFVLFGFLTIIYWKG